MILQIFLMLLILVQYVCTAQGLSNIDWEYRLKGDTIAFSIEPTLGDTLYDNLLFRKGSIIIKNQNNAIRFVSHSLRNGTLIPSNSIIEFDNNQSSLKIFHTRMNRPETISKNNFIVDVYEDYLLTMCQSNEQSIRFNQIANPIRASGWMLNDEYRKYNLVILDLFRIPNMRVLNSYFFLDKNIDSVRFKCVSIGNIVTDTNAIPYLTDYVLSLNPSIKTRKSIELPPQTSNSFEPIAHSFQELHQNHILLFGNVKDSLIDKNGYDIVIVDTTLNEIKRVSSDSTKMLFSNGIIYPTNLFTVNDKIFVTGYIDFGTMQYPFYSEHSSNGDFIKSQIVNTNSTIHSGSVSPDGKTVMLCGSVMNANDNKDFFVVAINTETGTHTQQTWGDNRENELFDVLAISNDTAYVTGSEDKDFYAGRLVNLQTMSVGEQTTFGNIEISPNPASSMCTITARNLIATHSTMTIQNMQGQTVATIFKGIPSNTEVQNISIEHLPMGAYFVTVQNGPTIHKTKFVIQR